MKSRKKTVKPIGLNDITIVDDAKMRKAITAAALGNAMEWFDFGVYGFVAYVLGKVFFPGADPGTQMIAALATFSVPFLIRPLGGLFFGALGDKYGRQKVLAATIVIQALRNGKKLLFLIISYWAATHVKSARAAPASNPCFARRQSHRSFPAFSARGARSCHAHAPRPCNPL